MSNVGLMPRGTESSRVMVYKVDRLVRVIDGWPNEDPDRVRMAADAIHTKVPNVA